MRNFYVHSAKGIVRARSTGWDRGVRIRVTGRLELGKRIGLNIF